MNEVNRTVHVVLHDDIVRVEVVEGTQINHDGRTYGPGEVFTATADFASDWIAEGWARCVAPTVSGGRQSS